MVKAKSAGSFLGGLFNNPTFLILGALAVGIFFFQNDIRKAFGSLGSNLGQVTVDVGGATDQAVSDAISGATDAITEFGGNLGGFFAGFQNQLEGFFSGLPTFTSGGTVADAGGLPLPPDVEDTGLLSPEERAQCECGTSIIQDIQGDVQEKCLVCQDPIGGGASIIGGGATEPICVDIPDPFLGGTFNTCTGEFIPFGGTGEPPFEPPVVLPPDFEGGGVSFEGGTIFETDICNKSIGQIAQENGISASAAADMKFQACEESDFDFGTNTGSGLGAGETGGVVTGGATLESEEKRAACVSCELFGLNCPICSGTI